MPLDVCRRQALELLVSEAVTNAVHHSEAPQDAPIVLAAICRQDEILVTVTDWGRGALPRMRVPCGALGGSGALGGYGLRMVDRQSRRWGVERAAGTSVWFAI